MKQVIFIASALTLLATAPMAVADTAQKPIAEWSCEDFMSVEASTQPTAVAYAEALNQKGVVEASVLDVNYTTTVSKQAVEACKQEPKASFMNKLRSIWETKGK